MVGLPSYTHSFKFKIGDEDIRGEAEFNVDGVASFKFDSGYEPSDLTVEQAERIPAVFAEFRRIFLAYDAIEDIELSEL